MSNLPLSFVSRFALDSSQLTLDRGRAWCTWTEEVRVLQDDNPRK